MGEIGIKWLTNVICNNILPFGECVCLMFCCLGQKDLYLVFGGRGSGADLVEVVIGY